MVVFFCRTSRNPKLIHLQIFSGEKRDKLASTAQSSLAGANAVAAVTQRCQLFYSDSLQMPPGQEAKINTICSVTGMQ